MTGELTIRAEAAATPTILGDGADQLPHDGAATLREVVKSVTARPRGGEPADCVADGRPGRCAAPESDGAHPTGEIDQPAPALGDAVLGRVEHLPSLPLLGIARFGETPPKVGEEAALGQGGNVLQHHGFRQEHLHEFSEL